MEKLLSAFFFCLAVKGVEVRKDRGRKPRLCHFFARNGVEKSGCNARGTVLRGVVEDDDLFLPLQQLQRDGRTCEPLANNYVSVVPVQFDLTHYKLKEQLEKNWNIVSEKR